MVNTSTQREESDPFKRLEYEIERFNDLARKLAEKSNALGRSCSCPYPYMVAGGGDGERIDLCFVGLLHGNEYLGTAIVNDVLQNYLDEFSVSSPRIGFALGNVEAARQNTRFLEYDLNRSFGSEGTRHLEWRRAKELESFLKRSDLLIDFHQTREQSVSPFFIFPYHELGFKFAHLLAPELPIVTHWGDSFSTAGLCSDEYVIEQGGVGITIEMGQNGFDSVRQNLGVQIAKRALSQMRSLRLSGFIKTLQSSPLAHDEIYTWQQVFEWPASGQAKLLERWENLSSIKAGTAFCEIDKVIYHCEKDGRVIFPYYPRPTDRKAQNELGRLIRKVTVAELPISL